MMAFGIGGMISKLIFNMIGGSVDACDWMVFAIWAVVAICGAIKEAKK